jgi:hypothetical protein
LTCRQTPALAPADPAEIGKRVCNGRATVCRRHGRGLSPWFSGLQLPLSMFACFLGSRPVFVQAAEIEEIPKGMTTIIYSLSCRT